MRWIVDRNRSESTDGAELVLSLPKYDADFFQGTRSHLVLRLKGTRKTLIEKTPGTKFVPGVFLEVLFLVLRCFCSRWIRALLEFGGVLFAYGFTKPRGRATGH
jgi:hypothetical protein